MSIDVLLFKNEYYYHYKFVMKFKYIITFTKTAKFIELKRRI